MPVGKQELLDELKLRIGIAEERGDWKAREIYTAAWHRVNSESERQVSVSGLAHRIAAKQAKIPLMERIGS